MPPIDPSDRDALRIFANPSLSPSEKQRLLGDESGGIPMPAPLPPEVSGPPPGAVAGPGGGGVDPSQANSIAAALAGPGPAPAPAPAPAALPVAPPPGGFVSDPTVANKGGIPGAVAQLQASAPQTMPDDPGAQPPPGGPPGSAPPPGSGPDLRSTLRLWNPPAGPAPMPMEQVHQSSSVTGSSVSPEQIAALDEAKKRADADALQQQVAEARIAQKSGDIQVAAEKEAQAQKIALEATRQQALARADQILAQQDRIGQQIMNTGPIMPGTMSSDNWSDTLFTVLSVFGATAGASSPEKAAEAVGRIANNEVQKQQAALDKKKGDFATLDNLYGKHLENLKDHELAKQATIADIYGRAQAEVQSMIQENGQAPDSLVNRRLQAQATALGAQRQEYMADIQAKLGPKLEQQEAVSFVRKHIAPNAPVRAPAGIPAAPATGVPVAAHPAAANSDTPAHPSPPQDAFTRAQDLWEAGHQREALAALPPSAQQAILAQATRKSKEKGLGEGATFEDYKAQALSDFGFKTPQSMVPESARARLVQIPGGGGHAFAATPEAAGKISEEFRDDAQLLSAYNQMAQLTKLPASAWTPEIRSRIQAIAETIKPLTSKSFGMSRLEKDLYNGIAGDDINGVKDFLLGTGKAQVDQALKLVHSRVRATAGTLSSTWQDDNPIGVH